MKYMIYILLMIGMLGYACSDDKDNALPTVRPEAKGTWVDRGRAGDISLGSLRETRLDVREHEIGNSSRYLFPPRNHR